MGVEALTTFVERTLGVAHVLVNNAGCMAMGDACSGEPDEWDRMLYLNLNGVMRLTRRLVPAMKAAGGGALINIGSIAAIEGMSGGSAAYAASKHGLAGWTRSIYTGLRHDKIKTMLVRKHSRVWGGKGGALSR